MQVSFYTGKTDLLKAGGLLQQQRSSLECVMDDILVLFIHFLLYRLHAVSRQKCVIGHEVRVPWPGFYRGGNRGQA